MQRNRTHLPPATQVYLNLRTSCRRADLPVPPGLTPLALVEELERGGHPASAPARRVVDLYLRTRYGGERLEEDDLQEMREALGAARRTLRARA